MAQSTIPLREADAVRITIVTDNSIDVLLAGSDVAHRFPLVPNLFERPLPVAEHGFSVLIEVSRENRQSPSCSTPASAATGSCTTSMPWRSMRRTSALSC